MEGYSIFVVRGQMPPTDMDTGGAFFHLTDRKGDKRWVYAYKQPPKSVTPKNRNMSQEQQDILKAIEMSLNTVEGRGEAVTNQVYRGEFRPPGQRTHYYPSRAPMEMEEDDDLAAAIAASLETHPHVESKYA